MSLVLNGITKIFDARGAASHTAVSNLSLEVEPRHFYTLLGPSGCGKTTLLRMIAGFEQPTAGEITHHGKRLNQVPPYERGFPMVFQSFALFPHMSVLENVSYGLKLRKLERGQIREKAERALALLELTSQRDKQPGQLSGGQQQRVALARALVLEPELILLDEPLSNLDAELRLAMRAEIRSLQQRLGITAIYVTHDQEEAMAISDRIVVMREGRIEQIGTPEALYRQPRTEFVARFMGNPNILPLALDAAGRLLLFGKPHDAKPSAGATHVVVRPEALHFHEQGRYAAKVAKANFLGARIQYQLTGDVTMVIDRPSDSEPLAEGSDVRFDIAADKLHFV